VQAFESGVRDSAPHRAGVGGVTGRARVAAVARTLPACKQACISIFEQRAAAIQGVQEFK
jgi:hypothetical protein